MSNSSLSAIFKNISAQLHSLFLKCSVTGWINLYRNFRSRAKHHLAVSAHSQMYAEVIAEL